MLLECQIDLFDGRGWGIGAALDAWGERLSFLVVWWEVLAVGLVFEEI